MFSRMPPGIKGLCVQLCALSLNLVLVSVALKLNIEVGPLGICLIQAVLSFFLSKMINADRWWGCIHTTLPFLIWFGLAAALPPVTYLFAFIFTSLIFSNAMLGQVPYFPMRKNAWEVIVSHIDKCKALRIIDIGSGIGGLSLKIASLRPNTINFGIEISPLTWFISVMRARFQRMGVRFMLGSYNNLDFSQFDIVITYLSPVAMEAIKEKACREMTKGALLISHEFPIIGMNPHKIVGTPDSVKQTYFYQF